MHDLGSTYVDQIPSPHLSILVATNDARLTMSEACSASIFSDTVSLKVVEHFARHDIHETCMGIEGRDQVRLTVLCWYDGSNGLCGTVIYSAALTVGVKQNPLTADKVRTKLPHAKVIGPDVTIHRACHDCTVGNV